MRHKVYGKHLNRDTNQRIALFKGLVRSLILNESITTTSAKAKAIKGLVDRLVIKAKENSSSSKRVVQSFIPSLEVNKRLFEELAPRYSSRSSGFTEVVRLGRRLGDGSMMVRMSLIKESSKVKDKEEVGLAKPKAKSRKKGE